MRPLNERQARRCEEAHHPRCRCRCGGILHGATRGGVDAPADYYEQLGDDDPHRIETEEVKAQRRAAYAVRRRRERRATTARRRDANQPPLL